jgi:hypothetical protein
VFGLSNQCSIVNRINLSTIEKKFGTRVRYAYIGRLCQRLTDFYKFYEKSYEPDFIWSSTYKSDYFRDEKFLVFLNLVETPRFKMARDKVHLNYGKSQTIRIYQLRVGAHLGFTMEITLPAFKPNSKYNRVTRNSC